MTKKQIEKKLTKLHKLLDQIDEAKSINPDEPETWDSNTLYNLIENLKTILQLLEDKKALKEKDEFGNPIILEAGLCSLIDEYSEEADGN